MKYGMPMVQHNSLPDGPGQVKLAVGQVYFGFLLNHTISTIYNAFDIGKNTLEKTILGRILLAAFMCVQWDVSPKFCICPTPFK